MGGGKYLLPYDVLSVSNIHEERKKRAGGEDSSLSPRTWNMNGDNKYRKLSWKVGAYSALDILQRVGWEHPVGSKIKRTVLLFDGTFLNQERSSLASLTFMTL